jgi:hypothetical protein
MKSKRMRWIGHVACIGDEKFIQILVGNPEGKRPRGRPRHRWEGNIRMHLWEGVD